MSSTIRLKRYLISNLTFFCAALALVCGTYPFAKSLFLSSLLCNGNDTYNSLSLVHRLIVIGKVIDHVEDISSLLNHSKRNDDK